MDEVVNAERRRAMALLGGSMMLAAAAPARAARSGVAFDLASEGGRARAYLMMRGALDERLVIGCVTGTYYAVVAAELTPLFGVSAATFARYRPAAAGGYEAVTAEIAYFTDLAGGAAIGRFANPFTGEVVDVPAVRSAPTRIRLLPNLDIALDTPPPGLVFDHHVAPPEVRGDDIWFTETTRTRATGGGKPFHYSETSTLHARLSELARPGAKRVACETGFTNVVDWRPWLKMGSRPGHMMAVGAGRYGVAMADLPPAWLAATRIHHPDVLANPAGTLEPVRSTKP